MVVGAAGYGKTRWLLDRVTDYASTLSEHGKLLALSRMHGGRRRLEGALAERCPDVPCTVTTIDSVALTLVNRWRRSLGASRPFVIGDDSQETLFGAQITFEQVLAKATEIMESDTVRGYISSTYPVIAVDEFQDCHGAMLRFIQSVAGCSTLLLAGDGFQLLDTSITACPALDWVRDLQSQGAAEIVELATCHRTNVQPILNTTRALRQGTPVEGESVPVFLCQGAGPAAYRIIERLVYAPQSSRWTGTCAVLSPSHDAWIKEVLESCQKQLSKKGLSPIHWSIETSEDDAARHVLRILDVDDSSRRAEAWTSTGVDGDPIARQTVMAIDRLVRSRGLGAISRGAVSYMARRILHIQRTRGCHSPKRIVSTIHGAKNREFDHVFILWPYRVTAQRDTGLRLLYNAVSRARESAMVLIRGDARRVENDPVLRLLGTPTPAITQKQRPKKGALP